MFDLEKTFKNALEKYIPAIVEAFEKNKKKDFLIKAALKFDQEIDNKSLVQFIEEKSNYYDNIHNAIQDHLNKK